MKHLYLYIISILKQSPLISNRNYYLRRSHGRRDETVQLNYSKFKYKVVLYPTKLTTLHPTLNPTINLNLFKHNPKPDC